MSGFRRYAVTQHTHALSSNGVTFALLVVPEDGGLTLMNQEVAALVSAANAAHGMYAALEAIALLPTDTEAGLLAVTHARAALAKAGGAS